MGVHENTLLLFSRKEFTLCFFYYRHLSVFEKMCMKKNH